MDVGDARTAACARAAAGTNQRCRIQFLFIKNVQSARPSFEKFQLTSLILILRLKFNKYVDATMVESCVGDAAYVFMVVMVV